MKPTLSRLVGDLFLYIHDERKSKFFASLPSCCMSSFSAPSVIDAGCRTGNSTSSSKKAPLAAAKADCRQIAHSTSLPGLWLAYDSEQKSCDRVCYTRRAKEMQDVEKGSLSDFLESERGRSGSEGKLHHSSGILSLFTRGCPFPGNPSTL